MKAPQASINEEKKIISLREECDDEVLDDFASVHFENVEKETNRSFALYSSALEIFSIFTEAILADTKFSNYETLIHEAEEKYQPNGPPDSSLTLSYFNQWHFFDLKVDGRTLADLFFLISADLEDTSSEDFQMVKSIISLVSNTRMGIYENLGMDGKFVVLKELVTENEYRAIHLSKRHGKKGDLWFARILPPFVKEDTHLVTTTPYILKDVKKEDCIEYFKKNGIDRRNIGFEDRLSNWMKYGPSIHYWNEFIFNSYNSHNDDFIFLTGLPKDGLA